MIEWEIGIADSPGLILMKMDANYPPFNLKIYSELRINEQKAKVNCLILKETLSRNSPELVYLYRREQTGDSTYLSKWIGRVVGIKKKELDQIALGQDTFDEPGITFPKESFKQED